MLTFDYDRLGVGVGTTLLDVGCGNGRHTYEALRRGASVVAADLDAASLRHVDEFVGAMREEGELSPSARFASVCANALRLPFPDGSFDRVVASETLEHIEDDTIAMSEIARVLRPGGRGVVSVPRWWPEAVCWALSRQYHSNAGGHVRIYRAPQLTRRLERTGLAITGTHHAHALHSPYWWIKCAVGPERESLLPRLYHRFLVWDLMARPRTTRLLEQALNPLAGKSLVVYVEKPATEELYRAA